MSMRPPSSPPSPPAPTPPPNYVDRQYLVSDDQVLVSVWVNALWGGLCILGFIILRGWVKGPGGVYQRRQELQDLFMRPPRLILGTLRQAWNWVMPMLAVSDADIVCCSGFDALVLTRVLLIGLQMFTLMTFLGIVVLIPVYYTHGGVEESSASLGVMARITVANIPIGSRAMVLPFCMTYVFVLYGCWVLLINCKCYAQLRMAYFSCLDALPASLQPELTDDGERRQYPRPPPPQPEADRAAANVTAAAVDTANPAPAAAAPAAGATAAAAGSGAAAGESSATGGSGGAGRNGWVRAPGEMSLEMSYMPGGGPPSSVVPRPLAEGVEGVAEQGVVEGTAGGGSTSAAAPPMAMRTTVRQTVSRPMPVSSILLGLHPEDAPVMSVRSTWLNMANFFNPTLRMMLDYLDWQNPLQRTAARFGVRDLRLPTLTSDQAPSYARLYGEDEPLLAYDEIIARDLRSDAPFESVAPSELPGYGGGNGAAPEGSRGGGGIASVPGADLAPKVKAGRSGAGGVADVVLPYWRPLKALQMMRHQDASPSATAESYCIDVIRGGGGGSGGATPALADASAGNPLVRSSSSAARWRKGGTSGTLAVASWDAANGAGAVGGSGGGGGGAAGGISATTGATPPATVATAAAKPPAEMLLHYGLRHCGSPRQDTAAAAVAATVGLSPAAAVAASSYGMTDPRQPLLPGKRNVRLLQLLQVPVRENAPDTAAPSAPARAGGGGAAAAAATPGTHSGRRHAALRCTTLCRSGASDSVAAAAAAADEDEDPVRIINASHYAVVIKRVHRKTGPGIIDRWAATTYVAVNSVRGFAQWATRSGKGAAAAKLTHLAQKGLAGKDPAADTSRAPLAAARGSAAAARDGVAGGGREERDVVAQAVAVAAAAAAAAQPLRGRAKVRHEVGRFYEMFQPASERVYDPLSEVTGADTRGKKRGRKAAAERPPAVNGGGAAAPPAEPLPAAGGAVAAVAAAVTATGEAEEEKARSDALEDPNGAAVAAVLRELFPKSFQGLIPVTNHNQVDKLIYKWDAKMMALGTVVRSLERLVSRQALHHAQPKSHVDVEEGKGSGGGATAAAAGPAAAAKADTRRSWWVWSWRWCRGDGAAGAAARAEKLRERAARLRADIRRLEAQILEGRDRALRTPLGTAYFALFSNSQDAQMLAQCQRVVPPQGPGCLVSFDAVPAPAPEDVSWPALWSTSSLQQLLRRIAIVLPMAIIFLIPIGPLQGALSNLDVSLCGGPTNVEGIRVDNKLYLEWFCEPKNLGIKLWKSLLTGVLPSIVGLVWTAVCMPQLLYLCSSISRGELSLSGQERQMQNWFFWYSLINTFLGAVLGGGFFSQLGTYLANPTSILDKIGRALPNSANFFIQFCIARALFTNFVRLIWPHAGAMLTAIFRSLLRCGVPRSLHAAALAHMPPSSRFAGYYNAILQVFMFGCAFAVVAPIILPCCWLFFLTAFFVYRYSLLYVYERNYESGGRMWPVLFDQIMGFLIVMEIFTGAIFVVNRAWLLAGINWVTITPPLLIFWRYCSRNYLEPMHFPPLSVVATEPRGVRLSPLTYLPPALRPGAFGWYPEQGKVWEKYGIPKHW